MLCPFALSVRMLCSIAIFYSAQVAQGLSAEQAYILLELNQHFFTNLEAAHLSVRVLGIAPNKIICY